ncbi:SanA/YdcF family protein [Pistricoccus aurantiacus]|uniref:SanA/YdcF family protein n=1 Tax=Pistricoccus aurantiacus TaxID=1883414 RepID=UPI003645AB90
MRLKGARLIKRILTGLGCALAAAALLIVAANLWVLGSTRYQIRTSLAACVTQPLGIVFGTTQWNVQGGRNPHFEARMQAAAELLRRRRIQHLLLSGDNRTRYYNEPITMWRYLREHAVPDRSMTLDYAGFSTFDTLVRARKVFGVERAILITQDWHLPRALYIADVLGINAIGCAAPTRRAAGSWRLEAREWLARVGMLGDLYLWHRQPYFLGPQEPLIIAPPRLIDDFSVSSSFADDKARESILDSLSSSVR